MTRNFVFVAVAEVFDVGVGLYCLAIIGRYLGKERFDTHAFILALTSVFRVITDFGITQIVIREIAKAKEDARDWLGAALFTQAILSLITLGLIGAGAMAYRVHNATYPDLTSTYICGFAVVFLFVGKLLAGITQAFERMEFDAAMTFLQQVVLLVGTIVAVRKDAELQGIFVAFLVSNLVYVVAGVVIVFWKFAFPRFGQLGERAKYLLTEGFPVGIKRIFGRLSLHCDLLVMKGLNVREGHIGAFRGGYRIVQSLMFLPEQLAAAAFPSLARLSAGKSEELERAVRSTVKVVLLFGMGFCGFLFLYAREIVRLLWKEKLSDSVLVLQVLAWMVGVEFARLVLGRTLIAAGKQGWLTLTVAIGMVMNVAFDFILIPTMERTYLAASIATLIGEVTILTASIYFIETKVRVHLSLGPLMKLGVGLAAWLVLGMLLKGWSLVGSFFAVLAFAMVLWVTGFVERDELAILKSMVRRIRGGKKEQTA